MTTTANKRCNTNKTILGQTKFCGMMKFSTVKSSPLLGRSAQSLRSSASPYFVASLLLLWAPLLRVQTLVPCFCCSVFYRLPKGSGVRRPRNPLGETLCRSRDLDRHSFRCGNLHRSSSSDLGLLSRTFQRPHSMRGTGARVCTDVVGGHASREPT